MPCQIIPFPQELRPPLPTIVGNVDYLTLRQRLEQIDVLLREGGVEREFVKRSWSDGRVAAKGADGPGTDQVSSNARAGRCAARSCARSCRRVIAGSVVSWPATHSISGSVWWMRWTRSGCPPRAKCSALPIGCLLRRCAQILDGLLQEAMVHPGKLGLKEALNVEEYFLDSTCLKANIHFPTDWVLLRDGVRTLMKATVLIRQAGLRGRMEAPEVFLRRINRLSIEMSRQARRAGSKKGRKRVLRQMKKLVGVVRAHARRHRELLDRRWEQTAWTRPQAEQILRRLDGVLELLPRAQKQAHERIIGGRPVANAEKILSLYDPDVRVIVRGKAGAEVEFGNTVLLRGEPAGPHSGLPDLRQSAPADNRLLLESLRRVEDLAGRPVGAAVTDRGFASGANSRALAEADTFDALCPRQPAELKRKMKEQEVRASAASSGSDRSAPRDSEARISGAADAGQGI